MPSPDLAPVGDPVPALVAQLAATLRAHGAFMATAESCTGGLIAAACTELAGSSEWFDRGYITYSNAAKTDLIGVPPELIASHGAVSLPVAHAMATGALQSGAAHWAVAVTGIAGPSGGSAAKPVGTVCFGWAHRPDDARDVASLSCETETCHFTGDRAAVRQQTVAHALRGLLARLRARPTGGEV